MNILLTGGKGYVGSILYKSLVADNHNVFVIDRQLNEDLGNQDVLNNILKATNPNYVIHLAGLIQADESIKNPLLYYKQNIANTINLLDVMQTNGVKNIIFASSCAIYGNKHDSPIVESENPNPLNPYSKSKSIIEEILKDCKFNTTTFRFFNIISNELINKNILYKIITNKNNFEIFVGHNTPDGSCIRDYIHVEDIAKAFILTINKQITGTYNLGTNIGTSLKQLIKLIESCGIKINTKEINNRTSQGDIIVANNALAKNNLKWEPSITLKETIGNIINEICNS